MRGIIATRISIQRQPRCRLARGGFRSEACIIPRVPNRDSDMREAEWENRMRERARERGEKKKASNRVTVNIERYDTLKARRGRTVAVFHSDSGIRK